MINVKKEKKSTRRTDVLIHAKNSRESIKRNSTEKTVKKTMRPLISRFL